MIKSFGIGMAIDHPDVWIPAKRPAKGNIIGKKFRDCER